MSTLTLEMIEVVGINVGTDSNILVFYLFHLCNRNFINCYICDLDIEKCFYIIFILSSGLLYDLLLYVSFNYCLSSSISNKAHCDLSGSMELFQ
jgi:hypothetical protein